MPRKSVLPDRTLIELRGVLKFVGTPLADILDKLEEPQPKAWTRPSHPADELGQVCNMSGWEITELQKLASNEILNNELLQKAFRDYMMVAKLLLSDKMESSRRKMRRIEEDKARSEAAFVQKHASYENKKKSLTRSWQSAHNALRKKWEYLTQTLGKSVEANPTLRSFASEDKALLFELEKLGLVEIKDRKILDFKLAEIMSLDIPKIQHVILNMESQGLLP